MKTEIKSRTFPVRLASFALLYLLAALIMFWVVRDDWTQTMVETNTVSMGYLLPENSQVSQSFAAPMDGLQRIAIVPHWSAAPGEGQVNLSLRAGDTLLWSAEVPAASLPSDQSHIIPVEPLLTDVKGRELTLLVQPNGTGLSLWAGTTVSAGKFDVTVATSGLQVDGAAAEGSLVLTAGGYNLLQGARWFWPAALILLAACLALAAVTHRQLIRHQRTLLTVVVTVIRQYAYLLKQLIWRDFRVKYKASALGVVWSFLNPLLTMLVYLFVFSTLFKSDVPYFPVYLMSGIVLFNYFSEATSLGMGSIVDNSALITKVYMPKMIYPASKVLSSGINLCISFIPLFLVMVVTGVPLHKSLLLLPLVVTFLLTFSMGTSLILATMNVFFRDTKFLWSVALTMLNFLTPVFYPESIIPSQFQTLYHFNPMYQILYFMRSIIIGGISPTPITYFYCLMVSVVPLALGLWIFRKNQDRFVLYL